MEKSHDDSKITDDTTRVGNFGANKQYQNLHIVQHQYSETTKHYYSFKDKNGSSGGHSHPAINGPKISRPGPGDKVTPDISDNSFNKSDNDPKYNFDPSYEDKVSRNRVNEFDDISDNLSVDEILKKYKVDDQVDAISNGETLERRRSIKPEQINRRANSVEPKLNRDGSVNQTESATKADQLRANSQAKEASDSRSRQASNINDNQDGLSKNQSDFSNDPHSCQNSKPNKPDEHFEKRETTKVNGQIQEEITRQASTNNSDLNDSRQQTLANNADQENKPKRSRLRETANLQSNQRNDQSDERSRQNTNQSNSRGSQHQDLQSNRGAQPSNAQTRRSTSGARFSQAMPSNFEIHGDDQSNMKGNIKDSVSFKAKKTEVHNQSEELERTITADNANRKPQFSDGSLPVLNTSTQNNTGRNTFDQSASNRNGSNSDFRNKTIDNRYPSNAQDTNANTNNIIPEESHQETYDNDLDSDMDPSRQSAAYKQSEVDRKKTNQKSHTESEVNQYRMTEADSSGEKMIHSKPVFNNLMPPNRQTFDNAYNGQYNPIKNRNQTIDARYPNKDDKTINVSNTERSKTIIQNDISEHTSTHTDYDIREYKVTETDASGERMINSKPVFNNQLPNHRQTTDSRVNNYSDLQNSRNQTFDAKYVESKYNKNNSNNERQKTLVNPDRISENTEDDFNYDDQGYRITEADPSGERMINSKPVFANNKTNHRQSYDDWRGHPDSRNNRNQTFDVRYPNSQQQSYHQRDENRNVVVSNTKTNVSDNYDDFDDNLNNYRMTEANGSEERMMNSKPVFANNNPKNRQTVDNGRNNPGPRNMRTATMDPSYPNSPITGTRDIKQSKPHSNYQNADMNDTDDFDYNLNDYRMTEADKNRENMMNSKPVFANKNPQHRQTTDQGKSLNGSNNKRHQTIDLKYPNSPYAINDNPESQRTPIMNSGSEYPQDPSYNYPENNYDDEYPDEYDQDHGMPKRIPDFVDRVPGQRQTFNHNQNQINHANDRTKTFDARYPNIDDQREKNPSMNNSKGYSINYNDEANPQDHLLNRSANNYPAFDKSNPSSRQTFNGPSGNKSEKNGPRNKTFQNKYYDGRQMISEEEEHIDGTISPKISIPSEAYQKIRNPNGTFTIEQAEREAPESNIDDRQARSKKLIPFNDNNISQRHTVDHRPQNQDKIQIRGQTFDLKHPQVDELERNLFSEKAPAKRHMIAEDAYTKQMDTFGRPSVKRKSRSPSPDPQFHTPNFENTRNTPVNSVNSPLNYPMEGDAQRNKTISSGINGNSDSTYFYRGNIDDMKGAMFQKNKPFAVQNAEIPGSNSVNSLPVNPSPSMQNPANPSIISQYPPKLSEVKNPSTSVVNRPDSYSLVNRPHDPSVYIQRYSPNQSIDPNRQYRGPLVDSEQFYKGLTVKDITFDKGKLQMHAEGLTVIDEFLMRNKMNTLVKEVYYNTEMEEFVVLFSKKLANEPSVDIKKHVVDSTGHIIKKFKIWNLNEMEETDVEKIVQRSLIIRQSCRR